MAKRLPDTKSRVRSTCEGSFDFPIKYGYQVVGEVVAVGAGVDFVIGDLVFARHPHQEVFTMRASDELLIRVPTTLSPDRAVFLNLLEVA